MAAWPILVHDWALNVQKGRLDWADQVFGPTFVFHS